MKAVAFIPIKLNNERLPGKNIKRFYDGTPLIQFIMSSLTQIAELDEIYVFCSDESINEYLTDNVRFLKRPEFLDGPEATPQDIIREFMNLVDSDIYMVSHVTSPFVSVSHLNECLTAVSSGAYGSAFTGERIKKLLWNVNREALNFDPGNIPRTQELPPVYAEVSAAYAFTKETFFKYNRRTGPSPYIVELSGVECIDIDYPEDFIIADAIYKQMPGLNSGIHGLKG